MQQSVQFLTFEIRSGTTFLGSANFPVANLGAPQEYAIKLANQKGKHAGMLNLTLQLYTGDVQVALNLMKATQTSSRAPVGGGFTQPVQQEGGVFSQPVQQGGGGFSQPVQKGGGGFSQPLQQGGGGFAQPVQKGGGGFSQPVQQGGGVCIQQQPPSSVAGGFQQPSTAPACRPIGGFTVSGSQLAGGVGVSRDQAGFSTPSTVTANSQGFQGYQQQHNLTERGAYVPQAGASTDGESSYPILPPQPIYNPAAVTHSAPPPTAVVTSTAPPLVESTTYMEEEIPTGEGSLHVHTLFV